MKISAKFNPQDLWVGAYWERRHAAACDYHDVPGINTLDVWVCLVPMLPIKFHFGAGSGRSR